MLKAFGWGALAASSLLIGAFIAFGVRVSSRTLGLIMAFGVGVLIGAVAYDLVADAVTISGGAGIVVGLLSGAFAFFIGDWLIDRAGGKDRKSATGRQAEGNPKAIVLGAVLDGIPESVVLGLSLLTGEGVSVAVLVAVFLSNLPESMAASSGLVQSGYPKNRVLLMWAVIVVVSGLASGFGFLFLDGASPSLLAAVNAFAAGAILTMVADTMSPEAYARAGPLSGIATTIGFTVAFGVAMWERTS